SRPWIILQPGPTVKLGLKLCPIRLVIIPWGLCTPVHLIPLCQNECSSDSECEGNLKCCSNGCGHVCKELIGNMSLRNTCGGCFLCISHGFSVMVIKSYIILVPPLCIN
uniref:WAP domain-containing protein n=1 Tax=Periophthalmus magnuspinnatus TaxID=409849 RepID=A0A3B4AX27_9GOBI